MTGVDCRRGQLPQENRQECLFLGSGHRLSSTLSLHGRPARLGYALTHCLRKASSQFRLERTNNTALPNASSPAAGLALDAFQTPSTSRPDSHPASRQNPSPPAPPQPPWETRTSPQPPSFPPRHHPPRFPPIHS